MTSGLRIALFVEGSSTPPTRSGKDLLEVIWNERLGESLGLPRFAPIVPISKKHLVAMDPRNPPMSGAGETLDQLMKRVLDRKPFDVAVIAWDLVPAWNPQEEFCRWTETVDLYRFLSVSEALPELWREKARWRFQNLSERMAPSARQEVPRLEAGLVLPICMVPMFEGLLVQVEGAVKRALGLKHDPKGWPRTGWSDAKEKRPDLKVLAPAISSLRGVSPKPAVLRTVRGDMKTHKAEWGEFLLRKLLADEQARAQILSHPIAKRLEELLAGY